MKPHRVYCDSGAYSPGLGKLEAEGLIAIYQFKYENRTKKIRRGAIPSDLRYEDLAHYTYDEFGSDEILSKLTYRDLDGVNSKFPSILAIVGQSNRRDAQHIDSAFMTGCDVFLTSDKGDIWSKRDTIYSITGLFVFHVPVEWNAFLAHVRGQIGAR